LAEIQFAYSGTFHNHSPIAFIDHSPYCPGFHKGCYILTWDWASHPTIALGQKYCVNPTSCRIVHKPGERPDICQLCREREATP